MIDDACGPDRYKRTAAQVAGRAAACGGIVKKMKMRP
jgi:hypothetical protein